MSRPPFPRTDEVRNRGGVFELSAGPVRQNAAEEVDVHQTVERALPDIAALCRKLGIRRLDLFGSATGASFDTQRSDVDVLVEFGATPSGRRFDTYFALKEGLELILGRPVDVVSADAVRNPYLSRRIAEQREELYAA